MVHFAPLSEQNLRELRADWPSGYGEALLRLAGKAARMFCLLPPDAPGLAFVGAQFNPASFGFDGDLPAMSASGKGADLSGAVQSCICEGVEFLSQLSFCCENLKVALAQESECGLSSRALGDFLELLAAEASIRSMPIRWIEARDVANSARVRVPAALCRRNLVPPEPVRPRTKLSNGCAAGPNQERAIQHGLLELIERDAAALWWRGGKPGRRLTASLLAEAAAFLEGLRRGVRTRVSWLLDITTDLGVPCVAALSADESGRGLVAGFAAHLTYAGAMRAAMLEMCQMELGLRVVELKVEQDGEASLGESDRKHFERARGLDARTCAALKPSDGDGAAESGPPGPEGDGLAWLAGRLARCGIEAYVVDLSRPQLGIAATQVLAPRLQPMPSDVVTPRLARQIEIWGGGFGLTNAIELI